MKILVCGSGIIGSLLIHTLAEAGNDISVLARGKRLMMNAMMFVMSKTAIGDHAVSNHCKHAVSEMEKLSAKLEEIMRSSGADLTAYNTLKSSSPSWQELRRIWG